MTTPRSGKVVPLTLETNEIMRDYLEALVRTGLYGNNIEQAARIILSEELRRLVFVTKTLPQRYTPCGYDVR